MSSPRQELARNRARPGEIKVWLRAGGRERARETRSREEDSEEREWNVELGGWRSDRGMKQDWG